MTIKEMNIIKQLGYSTFALYSYIKQNRVFTNKELLYNLGMSDQSRHRGFTALKKYNIIQCIQPIYTNLFSFHPSTLDIE